MLLIELIQLVTWGVTNRDVLVLENSTTRIAIIGIWRKISLAAIDKPKLHYVKSMANRLDSASVSIWIAHRKFTFNLQMSKIRAFALFLV